MLRLQFFHKAFPRSFGCKPVSKATRKTCAGVPLGGGGPYVQNARASGKIFLKQASPPSEMGQKFKKSEKTFRIFFRIFSRFFAIAVEPEKSVEIARNVFCRKGFFLWSTAFLPPQGGLPRRAARCSLKSGGGRPGKKNRPAPSTTHSENHENT